MLGKELRSSLTNTWLNYALPAAELRPSVERILAGEPPAAPPAPLAPQDALDLATLGLVLLPEVLDRTPPYVDAVLPGTPAAQAGLRPDDLLVFVGDKLVPSIRAVRAELANLERGAPVRFTVSRGAELLEITLQPAAPPQSP
jgi:serine protease Do